jgi:type II pantothenate kinase
MGIELGIDVGGSTTKIIGLIESELIGALQVRATDQITSLFGSIGNFLLKYGFKLEDVSSISLTGVGASYFDTKIYDIETRKVNEFHAIGYGALHQSGLEEAIVASMGTGTAYVRATKEGMLHLGGSGVGGGTILGLSSIMLGKSDIEAIKALANNGRLENVDLLVRDIIGHGTTSLPLDITASNFGNIKSTASESDLALGIINMVFETVGMLAVFLARNDNIEDVLLTGTLTMFPQAADIQKAFNRLTEINFIIPPNAVFVIAIGAACFTGGEKVR